MHGASLQKKHRFASTSACSRLKPLLKSLKTASERSEAIPSVIVLRSWKKYRWQPTGSLCAGIRKAAAITGKQGCCRRFCRRSSSSGLGPERRCGNGIRPTRQVAQRTACGEVSGESDRIGHKPCVNEKPAMESRANLAAGP